MFQPHLLEGREQVVDTMIGLTRLSNLHRTILAGSESMGLCLALRRRGFIRVATPSTCRIARGSTPSAWSQATNHQEQPRTLWPRYLPFSAPRRASPS